MTRNTSTPVALVIGGTSGIGAAVARRLNEKGNRIVVVGSRSAEKGEATLSALDDALYVQADLSAQAAATTVVERTLAEFGRLDTVVYSAGATMRIPHGDLETVTDDVWQRILGLNVIAPWHVVQAAAPALRQSGDGNIVVVGALAGADTGGSSIPYAVSKAAVHHMCKLLGAALGPEVRINAVAPGLIDTPWTEGWDAVRAAISEKAPLQRSGTPEDVAEVIMGLIAARYVTGQTVIVDGGLSLVP